MNTPTVSPTPSDSPTVELIDRLRTMPPLISVPKAAALIGLNRSAAYRYAASGDIPTKRFSDGRIYVLTTRLIDLVTGAEGPAAAVTGTDDAGVR